MTTIKDIAATQGKPEKLVKAAAASLGFTGTVTDELPESIAAKLQGPKQIGSGSNSEQSEPTQQQTAEQTKGQGLEDIHQAYFASTQNLQESHFETEKQIAIAQGKMEAHQIYMNRLAARNQTLQTLTNRDLGASVENWQTSEENYRAYIESERQKALSAWAHSDKTGKTLKQAAGEVKALIASFDI